MAHPYLGQIQNLVSDIDFGISEIECKHWLAPIQDY